MRQHLKVNSSSLVFHFHEVGRLATDRYKKGRKVKIDGKSRENPGGQATKYWILHLPNDIIRVIFSRL